MKVVNSEKKGFKDSRIQGVEWKKIEVRRRSQKAGGLEG